MRSKFTAAALLAAIIGSVATAADYTTLVDIEDMRAAPQFNLLSAYAFDGDTLYAIMNGIEDEITIYWEPQITRVDDFLGTPAATELVDIIDWLTVSDPNLIDPNDPNEINPNQFDPSDPSKLDRDQPLYESPPTILVNRPLVIDGQLQFVDQNTDAIWRMDTSTGVVTPFVSNEAIQAHTGLDQANLIDSVAISPWNDMTFHDQASDSILSVDPNGILTTLLDPNDFEELYGFLPSTTFSGGMTYDHRGVLYWTLSRSSSTGDAGGAIYRMDCDGTTSLIMAQIHIQDITFSFGNVAFNDLYYAPDGNLYFYDRASDGILYFDPNDPRLPWPTEVVMPDDLLFQYLTESQLVEGPMGNDFVSDFRSLGSDLTWGSTSKDSPNIYNAPLAGPVIAEMDYNRDTWVDISDLGIFLADFTAPDVPYDPSTSAVLPNCRDILPADDDGDGDVDLRDLPRLQAQFTGN